MRLRSLIRWKLPLPSSKASAFRSSAPREPGDFGVQAGSENCVDYRTRMVRERGFQGVFA